MARFEPFWETICSYHQHLWLGVMMMIFLFVLSLISLAFAEPGSNAFGITLVNIALIVVVGGIIVAMYRICGKRERRYY